jgi:hypothetical protein
MVVSASLPATTMTSLGAIIQRALAATQVCTLFASRQRNRGCLRFALCVGRELLLCDLPVCGRVMVAGAAALSLLDTTRQVHTPGCSPVRHTCCAAAPGVFMLVINRSALPCPLPWCAGRDCGCRRDHSR